MPGSDLLERPCLRHHVVATPIGNLADNISARGLHVLREVSLIAAEAKRCASKLLHAHSIHSRLLSCHAHNDAKQVEKCLDLLRSSQNVALISAAGTPLSSDPGRLLVSRARANGSGRRPIDPWDERGSFYICRIPAGPRPRGQVARVAGGQSPIVFYEAPHRLAVMLADISAIFGAERELFIAREITRKFASCYASPAQLLTRQALPDADMTKGELVIISQSRSAVRSASSIGEEELLRVLMEEPDPSQAAHVAAKLTGAKKRDLYRKRLALRASQKP